MAIIGLFVGTHGLLDLVWTRRYSIQGEIASLVFSVAQATLLFLYSSASWYIQASFFLQYFFFVPTLLSYLEFRERSAEQEGPPATLIKMKMLRSICPFFLRVRVRPSKTGTFFWGSLSCRNP